MLRASAVFAKDPQASLVYGWDWSGWLSASGDPSATVATSTWTITGDDDALTTVDQGFTTTETWIQLAAGTDDGSYEAENVVTFSNGETDVMTFRIRIRQQ